MANVLDVIKYGGRALQIGRLADIEHAATMAALKDVTSENLADFALELGEMDYVIYNDQGKVRIILSPMGLTTDYGISAFLATLQSDGLTPSWWVDANTGEMVALSGALTVGSTGINANLLSDVLTQIANDGTTYRKGRLGMITLPGKTAPSFGLSYQDNATVSELVTNGDFGTGDYTGWTDNGTISSTIDTGAAKINGGSRTQAINVTAGSSYTLKFKSKSSIASSANMVQVYFYSGAGATGTLLSYVSYSAYDTVFTNYEKIFVVPSGAASVKIYLNGSGAVGQYSYYDDISLKITTVANWVGFEPASGKVVSNMLDGGNLAGQVPVGNMSVLRIEEARDKVICSVNPYVGAGVDVGTHYYVCTFVDQYGETDADLSQATAAVVAAAANDQVNVSPPVGAWGTTSRKIYRTKVGGSSTDPSAYYYVGTIANNLPIQTLIDTTPDASLSSTTIPTVNTTGSRPIFPRSAYIHGQMLVAPNTISVTPNSPTYVNGTYYNMLAANANDGDVYSFSAMLEKGTYDIIVDGGVGSSFGIFDWYVDGVLVSSGQDWYAAASAYAQKTVSSVSIPTSGYHLFEIRANGKNAASTDYILRWSQIIVKQSKY